MAGMYMQPASCPSAAGRPLLRAARAALLRCAVLLPPGASWLPRTLTDPSLPRCSQLVSLHFTGEPPSLQAQLLPLPLPELGAKGEGRWRAE